MVFTIMVAVSIAGAALKGYVVHRWAIETWPELDAILFTDAGAIVGAGVGLVIGLALNL